MSRLLESETIAILAHLKGSTAAAAAAATTRSASHPTLRHRDLFTANLISRRQQRINKLPQTQYHTQLPKQLQKQNGQLNSTAPRLFDLQNKVGRHQHPDHVSHHNETNIDLFVASGLKSDALALRFTSSSAAATTPVDAQEQAMILANPHLSTIMDKTI